MKPFHRPFRFASSGSSRGPSGPGSWQADGTVLHRRNFNILRYRRDTVACRGSSRAAPRGRNQLPVTSAGKAAHAAPYFGHIMINDLICAHDEAVVPNPKSTFFVSEAHERWYRSGVGKGYEPWVGTGSRGHARMSASSLVTGTRGYRRGLGGGRSR